MKKNEMYISFFWKKFRFYRKAKGGYWYKIRIPKGPATDGFEFWSRTPPNKGWGESLADFELWKV